jgi:hypothetical protein
MPSKVNIGGIPKATVLVALWNAAKKWSVFDVKSAMSESRALKLTSNSKDLWFDWVDSRCLKVDLTGDQLDPILYDRDNGGAGAAARVIDNLRRNVHTVMVHKYEEEIPKMESGAPPQVYGDSTSQTQARQEDVPQGGSDVVAPRGDDPLEGE